MRLDARRSADRPWGRLFVELGGAYAAAWAIGIAFGLVIASFGVWHTGMSWERAILVRVHDWTLPAWADQLLSLAPYTGTNLTMLPAMLVAAFWLWRWKHRLDISVHLLVVCIGALSLNPAMKYLLGRERPELFPRRGLYAWASYPSGHAILSVALLLTIALLLRRELGWRWPFAAAVLLVCANLYSRIYLQVHWPSDLIGGALIGIVWLLGTWIAFQRFDRLA